MQEINDIQAKYMLAMTNLVEVGEACQEEDELFENVRTQKTQ